MLLQIQDEKEEKMAAVHYLRFPVSPEARAALANAAADARIVVDHPSYKTQAERPGELLADLACKHGVPADGRRRELAPAGENTRGGVLVLL